MLIGYERRLEFMVLMQIILHENPKSLEQLLSSDESTFDNNGSINENPD